MVRSVFILLLLVPVSAVASLDISGIRVTVPYFSPNGDGVKDLTGIKFDVASDHDTVYVWVSVIDADGVTVKTLAEAEPREPGRVDKLWYGRDASGAVAPEGVYKFEIIVMADSESRGPVTASVVLDITAPGFDPFIHPTLYVPNLPFADSVVTIEVTTVNSQPEDWLSVWVAIEAQPETVCTVQLLHGDSTYECYWDGREKQEGDHDLFIRVWDEAGNDNQGQYSIEVDLGGPTVQFTYPQKTWLSAFPDSVAGFALDRNGVDSIGVRFSSGTGYGPVSAHWSGDTLFWYAGWPDDLTNEGRYDVECLARDSIGYETIATREVRVDTTAPNIPTLTVPDRVSSPAVTVRGTCSGSDSVFLYLIWQDVEVLAAKLVCAAAGEFEKDLVPGIGENRIYATSKDKAWNISGPSDTATVTYEEKIGLVVPERIISGSRIEVNLSRQALSITMRVFSVDGHYVGTEVWYPQGLYNEFEWDLKDADGDNVRNGVYLLVFEVSYSDGTKSVEKKVAVVSR